MVKILPTPKKIETLSEKTFHFTHVGLGKSRLSKEGISDFEEFCALPTGEANIVFKNDPALGAEAYTLKIGSVIEITASSMAGELYALQTLKQLFVEYDFNVPELYIEDAPKSEIRGFMLDVGRYFFSVDGVKLILRRMLFHKLNLFHFHLTEDQGFRVEIYSHMLLHQIGSRRPCTNFNTTPHSGYYTKEQVKEIVDYAHALGIKVMPEYDIPGHNRAAIAAYNDLACFPRDLTVATHWGVKHDVLCAGKSTTLKFVFDVIDEFCEMFPDKYFHIGGDEVPKHRWNMCPYCQKKIKDLGLKDADELQCWFMNTVKDYLVKKGKQVFMWSWDLKDPSKLDQDLGFTLCSDEALDDRAFIDTATSAYYIDLPYGYVPLKATVEHRNESKNSLGVEATLWTEYVPNMKKADEMTFPRLGAVSETGWNGGITWQEFEEKLPFYMTLLDKNKWGYTMPKAANPNKLRGTVQDIWFEKRQLTWQGLYNIFDDKAVEKMAKSATLEPEKPIKF